MYQHKHHIIPKHEWKERFGDLKGVNDTDNICYLTTEQHAHVHLILFEMYNRENDRIAWLGLSSQIGEEEIIFLKNSVAHKNNKFRLGKKHTQETKDKMRNRKLGTFHTEESKKKMGLVHKGNKYNLGRKHTEEWKLSMSERNSKNKNPNYGNIYSSETRRKISMSRSGKSYVVKNKIWVITTPEGELIRTQNISEFCRKNNIRSSGISWAYHKNKLYMGYGVTREILYVQ